MAKQFNLDLSSFSGEFHWLLAFLQADEHPDAVEQARGAYPEIDWKLFLKLVKEHRLHPYLYSKLRKWGEDLVPGPVLQALYRDYSANTFQMMALCREMEGISRAFGEAGIRTLMLKGPILAEELYGDLSLRTSKDLDLLIQFKDLEQAEQLLTQMGYEADRDEALFAGEMKARDHHASYQHPQSKFQIEVHWRLDPDAGSEPQFDEMWERKKQSTLTSYPVYYLGSEDLFMHLVAHGARHGWFRLRWLLDIDRMARKGLEWESVISLLKLYHNHHMGGQALILASELMRMPLTPAMSPLTSGRRAQQLAEGALTFIQQIVDPRKSNYDIHYFRYLMLINASPQKWQFVMSRFYPTTVDAQTLPLPRQLYFLYFPLRPFLWCWRQFKKQAY